MKHEIFTSDDLPPGQPFPESTSDQNILSSPALKDRLEKRYPGMRAEIQSMAHQLRFPNEYNKNGQFKTLSTAFFDMADFAQLPFLKRRNDYERGAMLRPEAEAIIVTNYLGRLIAEGEDLSSLGLPQRLINGIAAAFQNDMHEHLRRD